MSAFTTTRWSLIVRAKNANTVESLRALDDLCAMYRPALLAYAGALAQAYHWNASSHDLQDVVQDFSVERLLNSDFYEKVSAERGLFRSFLKKCFKNFFLNRLEQAKRRESHHAGNEILDFIPAPQEERAGETYDRAFAEVLVTRAMGELERDYARRGQEPLLQALRPALVGETHLASHRELAAGLGMSEDAVKMAAMRLRRHYRDLVLQLVRESVEDPSHAAEEARYLHRLLAA